MNNDPGQRPGTTIPAKFNSEHAREASFFEDKTQLYLSHEPRTNSAPPIASNPYEPVRVFPQAGENTQRAKSNLRRRSLFFTIIIIIALISGSVTYISFREVQSTSQRTNPPATKTTNDPAAKKTVKSLPGMWTQCAAESATCSFDGTMTVAYGANGKFDYTTATTNITCASASFGGDPIVSATKACYLEPAPLTQNVWFQCAAENNNCSFKGTMLVAFGADSKFHYTAVTTSTACTNEAFGGDPIVDTLKACYVIAPPATTVAWNVCATENGTCSFSGIHEVAYGANGQYSYGIFTDQVSCNDSTFSASANNSAKSCYYQ